MCTDWSSMMEINWPRIKQEEKDRRLMEARRHLSFCMGIYRRQMDNDRHFLHEHPASAKFCKGPYVKKISEMQDVLTSRLEQCQYGLRIGDKLAGNS